MATRHMNPLTCCHILKVYKETLTTVRHIYHIGVFNTTSLSQGYVLEAESWSRKGKQELIFQGQERGEEPGSSSWVNLLSHLFNDLPQH